MLILQKYLRATQDFAGPANIMATVIHQTASLEPASQQGPPRALTRMLIETDYSWPRAQRPRKD